MSESREQNAPQGNRSDEQWVIRRFCAGDVAAFGKLIDWYSSDVLDFFRKQGLSFESSSDAAQVVWINAWRGRRSLDVSRKVFFRAWLRRIAFRVAYKRAGKNGLRVVGLDKNAIETLPSEGTSDLCPLWSAWVADVIRFCVQRLDPELRAIVFLRFYHSFSGRKIGQLVGLPEATVRNRMKEALEILRLVLHQRFGIHR